jgi:ATP-dependent protease HslVU (ClpYQ) peptidase subunit
MSTITVVRKNGWAAIAADTMTSYGSSKETSEYIVNHEKILCVNDSYIGIAGPASTKLVLKNYFSNLKTQPDLIYVDSIFATWLEIHEALKSTYFIRPEEDADDSYESSRMDVLIANRNGIFGVEARRTVQEYAKFSAYGTGDEYALGAMYAVYDLPDKTAEDIARLGVQAAAQFDKGTGLPVISYSVELAQQ